MIIDGQNNLHMRNTHIVEETKFAKFFNLRGSARETLDEEERERERVRERIRMLNMQNHLFWKEKKNGIQMFNILIYLHKKKKKIPNFHDPDSYYINLFIIIIIFLESHMYKWLHL